ALGQWQGTGLEGDILRCEDNKANNAYAYCDSDPVNKVDARGLLVGLGGIGADTEIAVYIGRYGVQNAIEVFGADAVTAAQAAGSGGAAGASAAGLWTTVASFGLGLLGLASSDPAGTSALLDEAGRKAGQCAKGLLQSEPEPQPVAPRVPPIPPVRPRPDNPPDCRNAETPFVPCDAPDMEDWLHYGANTKPGAVVSQLFPRGAKYGNEQIITEESNPCCEDSGFVVGRHYTVRNSSGRRLGSLWFCPCCNFETGKVETRWQND
ncbi:MAG: hypothetical protein ACREJ2_07445, partial [Planctomycetota bacterium]